MTRSFRDLVVWQKARDLAFAVYQITDSFPDAERYGLSSQMRRSAISISSNIAESYNRFHSKEKRQFLSIAYGSGSELESQMEVAKMLFVGIECKRAEELLGEVMRILNKFVHTSKF